MTDDRTGDYWLSRLVKYACRGVRSAGAWCLVGAEGVVGVAELVDLDGEGIAVAGDRAEEVFVLQDAQEPFDFAVGPRSAHPDTLRDRSTSDPAAKPDALHNYPIETVFHLCWVTG
ncbi:hypothetical protein QFZ24_000549 [Streptomyces phaeochromogenes]|nr:hypothetical protein [Streptomyces phaeochromogenes]